MAEMVRCPECSDIVGADAVQVAGGQPLKCWHCGWGGYIDETNYRVTRGEL